ncbi:uncharacterized protein LOC143592589 [Bidens hawaiensis]|uniref:uncharacterized protein LOC143592589 n=1 Tax=Bidens hawaiensis TaxID=980011 RepID=UPI00404AF767
MGACTSCHTTPVATGKLILPDGELHEFAHPINVSDILNKYPSTFICNSDEMDFDDVIAPVEDHEDLQPGGDAALAVKASAALAKCSSTGRHTKKNICFTTSSEKRHVKSSSRVADVQTIGLSRKSGGGGKKSNFKVMLSAIPE